MIDWNVVACVEGPPGQAVDSVFRYVSNPDLESNLTFANRCLTSLETLLASLTTIAGTTGQFPGIAGEGFGGSEMETVRFDGDTGHGGLTLRIDDWGYVMIYQRVWLLLVSVLKFSFFLQDGICLLAP